MTTTGREHSVPGTGRPLDENEILAAVDQYVTEVGADVQRLWSRALEGTPDAVLGDIDLPARLARLTRNGGKRIRPLMCHWGFVCAGGTSEAGRDAAIRAGAALELLHTFALVHDDVMDESDTRRGEPAAHVLAAEAHRAVGAYGSPDRYGESIAILIGDLAHTMADALIATLPPRMRRLWFELNIELIAGQREDLSGAATGPGDLRRAWRIARIKSGAYTVTRPLQLGALAADADDDVLTVLESYGDEMGWVFAARDDLLGAWGDPRETGKPSGDDLRQHKPTTLRVEAQNHLDGPGLTLLERVGTTDERPGDVEALQDAMTRAGIRERAEHSISDGVDRAVTILHRADGVLHADGIRELVRMTRHIAWRTS